MIQRNFYVALFTITLSLALEAQHSKRMENIEFQMGRDEQALVQRTYENADNFGKAVNKELADLQKKLDKSTGAQKEARIARKKRLEAMNRMINGCLIPEWQHLEEHRAANAEIIDQLIQSFQTQLQ